MWRNEACHHRQAKVPPHRRQATGPRWRRGAVGLRARSAAPDNPGGQGLTNSHLYEIRADGVRWSTPYPDQDWAGEFLDARKARLGDVLEDVGTKTLKYLYDFGDGWEHTIKVERLIDPEPGILYPRLIKAKGRCPPEDVGGPWGYAEFLEAIADPNHERHRELKEW